MLRHVVRLAVATLAVAAAGVVASGSPAGAATCGSTAGVSVVVDFHQLGSGAVQSACDSGGAGKYASAQFADVGHTLTFVQSEPFVCQVDGLGSPQCAHTPPANAYWSLWWSDGKSGTWTYASLGVASLKVPAGGYVALSWQKGTTQVPPRVSPKAHTSATPTAHPTSHPTSRPPSPTGGTTSAPPPTPSTSATPSGSNSATGGGHRHQASTKQARPHHHPGSTPSAGPSDEAGTALPTGSSGDGGSGSGGSGSGGLPGWVAPAGIVALFVAGGAVALVRRTSSGGP
ncbi:MAG: hypothetical protein QM747_01980 [Nocardioides sp.]